jgi:S-adenosylmethionine:tRNA ribosyltransferase-isomerase
MKTIDFDYQLPEGLIAQFPSQRRDECRLLCLDRAQGSSTHRRFDDLPTLLRPTDRLIFNDTKVLPARVMCRKETGAVIELLFTERINDRSWKALAKPTNKIKPGTFLLVENEPSVRLRVDAMESGGTNTVSLSEGAASSCATIDDAIQRFGTIPLPPYIKRQCQSIDSEMYQTVFAKKPGAIASPTASLHFTEGIMHRLREKGIAFSFLTLHVGIGTFRPVTADDPYKHHMHEEKYELGPETVQEMLETRKRGGRNIAVGTTVVRVLEHCSMDTGFPVSSNGSTRLLILPGFPFKAIDGLITNFHVPQSTLLMLVCAFAGKQFVLNAYHEAIERNYRFFSYGDAMMIL